MITQARDVLDPKDLLQFVDTVYSLAHPSLPIFHRGRNSSTAREADCPRLSRAAQEKVLDPHSLLAHPDTRTETMLTTRKSPFSGGRDSATKAQKTLEHGPMEAEDFTMG